MLLTKNVELNAKGDLSFLTSIEVWGIENHPDRIPDKPWLLVSCHLIRLRVHQFNITNQTYICTLPL